MSHPTSKEKVRHPERLNAHRLIHGAHHVVRNWRQWRGQPLWTLVSEITSHGSTYSMEICEDLGFNPHHKIGDSLERRPDEPVRPTPEPEGALGVTPIARVNVEDGQIYSATMYAPGLPDGEHDLFPVPLSPKGELRQSMFASVLPGLRKAPEQCPDCKAIAQPVIWHDADCKRAAQPPSPALSKEHAAEIIGDWIGGGEHLKIIEDSYPDVWCAYIALKRIADGEV